MKYSVLLCVHAFENPYSYNLQNLTPLGLKKYFAFIIEAMFSSELYEFSSELMGYILLRMYFRIQMYY